MDILPQKNDKAQYASWDSATWIVARSWLMSRVSENVGFDHFPVSSLLLRRSGFWAVLTWQFWSALCHIFAFCLTHFSAFSISFLAFLVDGLHWLFITSSFSHNIFFFLPKNHTIHYLPLLVIIDLFILTRNVKLPSPITQIAQGPLKSSYHPKPKFCFLGIQYFILSLCLIY